MLKTYLPQLLIFIGMLFTFLGGLIAYTRQNNAEETNMNLVRENNKLSQLINNNLMGGNTYGSVHPLVIMNNNEQNYLLYFENMGDYPLYDVRIEMWNPDDFRKHDRTDWRATIEDLKNRSQFDIGNIPVHGGTSLGPPFRIADGDKVKLNFHITAKNGSFSELLRIIKIKGDISVAEKVNTIIQEEAVKQGAKPKILLNKIGEKYPRDQNGEIQWD